MLAKRWLGRLPARHHTVLGNHDLMHNNRTPKQWAAVYGYESQNYVVDFPTCGSSRSAPTATHEKPERSGTLSANTLKWLFGEDPQRARQDVLDRLPLAVPGNGEGRHGHALHLGHDEVLRQARRCAFGALLARYPNAKAWLSGHTHSPIDAPGLVTRAKLPGGKKIVSVNFSAIVGVGKKRDASRPRALAIT